MTKVQHGGGIDRAIALYGGHKSEWLDLSTGINPTPYPIPDMPNDVWHRLPDESLLEACLMAARSYYKVPEDAAIVAAPGTQAIIQRLPELLPTPDIAIVSPTYNEYERCYTNAGAQVHKAADFDAALKASNVVVVGNPNNPDGRSVGADKVKQGALSGAQIIVDEAFADVAPDCSLVGEAGGSGLLVLKSFGKFFGLAGLRLGFAIGETAKIDALRMSLGPWAVSGPALFIGEKAMRDSVWINEARSTLSANRKRLEAMLSAYDFAIEGSTDLFVTASRSDSSDVAKVLAQNHILVREFDYAPEWIRFGFPPHNNDFARLEAALTQAD
ncbi:threonine-phosphate decarboxylase CobD [Ahrensia kielensis]|uniref:threonine-phosphate decarboxylase CobD n=1 Tax=Ahrensia kielensis TaxID=76980 RepID=UPI0003610242|nr:threonine-phosphate decarboxylase CobD [Ahrensia kielensis]